MPTRPKASILIVEDYHSVQVIYSTVLEKAGYDIATAVSGTEALEMTTKRQFDVIILDIVLLDMDGLTFLKTFDCSKHPHTRIIVMSNMDDPNLRQQALDQGAVNYILKETLTPHQLLSDIEAVLSPNSSRTRP